MKKRGLYNSPAKKNLIIEKQTTTYISVDHTDNYHNCESLSIHHTETTKIILIAMSHLFIPEQVGKGAQFGT